MPIPNKYGFCKQFAGGIQQNGTSICAPALKTSLSKTQQYIATAQLSLIPNGRDIRYIHICALSVLKPR
jgi:hypothetical protein